MCKIIIHEPKTILSLFSPSFASAVPSPLSFTRWLLDLTSRGHAENIDGHFRPQWGHCPLCLLQFDVVGKLETFDDDMMYIFNALNVTVS